MGFYDEGFKNIGTQIGRAGAMALSYASAKILAKKALGDKLDELNDTNKAFNERLDSILQKEKDTISDTINHPYGQATVHKALGEPYAGKKVTLREDDNLSDPGIRKSNIDIIRRAK